MEKPTAKPAWTSANISEPSSTLKASGWVSGDKPYAEHFNWLLRNLSEWVEYLEEKVGSLETQLEAERLRALAAEQSVANQVYTEQLRANAQETLLNSRLAVLEAMYDHGEIEALIQAETTRATQAEAGLQSQITANSSAISSNTTAIQTEASTRAAADTALQNAINAIPAVDPALQTTVDGLVTNLAAETTRATSAEASLLTLITNETTRSTTTDAEQAARLTIVEARLG